MERQAEKVRNRTPLVADDCLAIRTVMRDDGKYPLDPPGVKLYQQLHLIAASVERVLVVHTVGAHKKAVTHAGRLESVPTGIRAVAHALQLDLPHSPPLES